MELLEQRRALKRSTPQRVLDSQHVQNTIVLPRREDLLDRLPTGGVVAEVGVAFADFTLEIRKRTSPHKLHLIDMWGLERYSEGFVKVSNMFNDSIQEGTVEINRGMSTDVLRGFSDNYFDWVYIDTDHSYKLTSEELRVCNKKVKSSGRILGHDFTSGNVITPWPYGVIEACHEFCIEFNWQYEYLTLEPHGHFSFCLKRIEL